MKIINNKLRAFYLVAISGSLLLTACNKDLEQLTPIAKPTYPSGASIAATIAANPGDSLFNRMIIRSGVNSTLFSDSTRTFTLFIPDNTGMKIFINAASGGLVPLNAPDATFSGFISTQLRPGQCDTLIRYITVGQKFPSSSISTAFPNFPLTNEIILDPTQPFVRMNIFPVRGNPYSYINNIPLTAVDQAATNGVIHHTYTLATPPSRLLKDTMYREATLTYFKAAIARADSGSVGLGKLDSLLGYGATNMTVLAPNDNAFKTLIFGLAFQSYLSTRPLPYTATDTAIATATGNGAVAAGPAFLSTNNVTTAQVKGIMAYHIFATLTSSTSTPYQPNIRVFSVNVPSTPTFVKTLVNGGLAIHPGVLAQATYSGAFVTGLKFTGYGTGTFPAGAPFSGAPANVVALDRQGVNGVYHIIDKVLLPQ
jgi:Fasciclin domain